MQVANSKVLVFSTLPLVKEEEGRGRIIYKGELSKGRRSAIPLASTEKAERLYPIRRKRGGGRKKNGAPKARQNVAALPQVSSMSLPGWGTLPVVHRAEEYWVNAHRVEYRRPSWRPSSGISRAAYLAMAQASRNRGVDLRETCRAAAAYNRRAAVRRSPYRVGPAQMAGPFGERVWQEWRMREGAKGGDRPGEQQKVIARAIGNVLTPEAELVAELRHRIAQARRSPSTIVAAGQYAAAFCWAAARWGDPCWRPWVQAEVGDVHANGRTRYRAEGGPEFLREWGRLQTDQRFQRTIARAWQVATRREGP